MVSQMAKGFILLPVEINMLEIGLMVIKPAKAL